MPTETTSRSVASKLALPCALIALLASIAAIWFGSRQPKIGYVRSQRIVYEFAGMKEAQRSYEAKQQKWSAEYDTLESNYRLAVSRFNADAPALSPKERDARAADLERQQEYLQRHSSLIKGQAAEEDQKMTQGVLNQINTYVEEYGKSHGYDLIIGTTQAGSLLYGAPALDITDQVLAGLNAAYGTGGKAGK